MTHFIDFIIDGKLSLERECVYIFIKIWSDSDHMSHRILVDRFEDVWDSSNESKFVFFSKKKSINGLWSEGFIEIWNFGKLERESFD